MANKIKTAKITGTQAVEEPTTTRECEPTVIKVLDEAKKAGLKHVIVIGLDINGESYHAGTTSDEARINKMLNNFKQDLKL